MTPGTVAFQAPLSMGFPRQEYWTGLPYPSVKEWRGVSSRRTNSPPQAMGRAALCGFCQQEGAQLCCSGYCIVQHLSPGMSDVAVLH